MKNQTNQTKFMRALKPFVFLLLLAVIKTTTSFAQPVNCNAHFNHYLTPDPGEIHFSAANNPPGTTYAWDFGDGTTGNQHSLNHLFAQTGTYYVCLTVTDSAAGALACTSTWCDSIHITIPVPVCNAHFNYNHGEDPTEIHFSPSFN